MTSASVLPSREMTQWRMHRIAVDAVDDTARVIRPDLNKKGRIEWVANEMKVGFDRVRKAYQKRVKCIEHHEIMTWEERYVRLLLKWETTLAANHEQRREKIKRWQERVAAHAAADPARAAAGVDQSRGG